MVSPPFKDCLLAAGRTASGTFSFKRLVCPRCQNTLRPSRQSQEESLTPPLPVTPPQALVTHRHWWVSSRPENPRPLEGSSLRNGRPFPQFEKGSPFSPVWDQAAKLFFGLQSVQMQNEGRGQAVRETAAAGHRQSEWTQSQAAPDCVTLASWGTSLGLSLLIPNSGLGPPSSQPCSNPAHLENGHFSDQSEHP